jgi:diguanylate cyclase (GGDEF)-like protein
MSDFDLTDLARAQQLHEQERRIMESRTAVLDLEEDVVDKSGQHRWYRTSKVPLTGKDGRIVGLAGMTVDTTAVKQLERELIESRDRLSLAMSEMSDGLALFDRNGYLVFCNDQYRDAFPRSAHTRVPGAHINEILLECARTGEQLGIPEDDVEGWAERVGSLLRVPNVVTVELFNGSYLQLRNQLASNDSALVIVTDVTDLKLAELALIEANADLSRKASTDALTGLANRRVFDEALERDMARCGRAGTPLSLILLDVDRFKHYNDFHGHQAGDRCLVMVANAIKTSLLRPADLAARYGGEEFAVILPDTGLAGAEAVAERIRTSIAAASTYDLGSEVTASLGVAEYDLTKAPTTPESLVRRADGALYSAKAAGRNRVMAAAAE